MPWSESVARLFMVSVAIACGVISEYNNYHGHTDIAVLWLLKTILVCILLEQYGRQSR